ncbi:MAG: class I SAM-dependent methyltransferase [Planctomycetota bacterium]
MKCPECTFVYAHPLPTEEELLEYYGKHVPAGFKPHRGLIRRFKYYSLIRSIRKQFPRSKGIRLLEIGCSQGRLLSTLQLHRRFDSTGVDLTELSVEYARGQGLDVRLGTLQSQSFPDESFDAVVALQTVEHLLDPIGELEEIHRVLRKGGIFLATVPCVTHYRARMAGMKWKYYGPPGHLWYFSPDSFRRLFEKTGFEPVSATCYLRKSYLKAIGRKAG